MKAEAPKRPSDGGSLALQQVDVVLLMRARLNWITHSRFRRTTVT